MMWNTLNFLVFWVIRCYMFDGYRMQFVLRVIDLYHYETSTTLRICHSFWHLNELYLH
jgi:hypothetical protein